MCGIAGVVRFDGGARERVAVAREMRRRLPPPGSGQGEGEWDSPYAILEHSRLALVDRERGAQPMTTPDGRYTLVYNGEIYDHARLRGELAFPFRTRSDAETVLAAFAAWGESCLERLDGMFAFFVWDAQGRRGFAARDRLSVKPFAFAWDGSGSFFSRPEAAALVHARQAPVRPHAPADPRMARVAPAFSGVEHPMFEDVDYLPPGHMMSIGPEGPRVRRWWRFEVGTERSEAEPLRAPSSSGRSWRGPSGGR